MLESTIPTKQINKLVEAFVNAATSVHTRITEIITDQRKLITDLSDKPSSTYVMDIVDLMVTPDFHMLLDTLSSVQGKYPLSGKTMFDIVSRSEGEMGKETGYLKDSLRVGAIARDVAQTLGADGVEPADCYWGGALHDIGKAFGTFVSLPVPEVMVLVRAHAPLGGLVLDRVMSSVPLAAIFAWEHHENVNGDGYPRGLPYKRLSIAGHIAHLSDVFEAIVTRRNRDPLDTLQEIQSHYVANGRDGDFVFRAFAKTVKQSAETWFQA